MTRWPRRVGAAVAGFVAAGAALSTAELVSGLLAETPSLVLAVADVFVAETPGGLVRWSIETFGADQKTILVAGIVAVSLLLGAVGGLLARKRFLCGALGVATFGVVGGWAASRGEPGSSLRAWLAVAVAVAIGVGVLRLLLRPPGVMQRVFSEPALSPRETGSEAGVDQPEEAAPTRATGPEPQAPDQPGFGWQRRWFVTASAGTAIYGILGAVVGGQLRRSRNVDRARDEVALQLGDVTHPEVPPDVTSFDGSISGISPLVTPNRDFYRIDTSLMTPQVDPDDWTLRIFGMVDREMELSFDELLAMERIERFVTLACVSNEVGGDLVGNALWSGVPLAALLQRAGVQAGATQIVGRAVDDWTSGFPTEVALDGRPAMVAITMNGEPLPTAHGFPARLIVPGLYGYVSATKWLSEIELTSWNGFDAYWIPRGWAKEGPIKTQSRIDVPRDRDTLRAGRRAVAGVAWAPLRSIARVEVRVDDGPWEEARLSGVLSESTWVQWLYDWDAPSGEHRLQVRATDGAGEVQTSDEARPAPSGATGHHTIDVDVE